MQKSMIEFNKGLEKIMRKTFLSCFTESYYNSNKFALWIKVAM
jgi:hypothetical protein